MTGFASPQRQLPMLWDFLRVNAFRSALEGHAPGKVVVEIGCGHGVLACLAVRAGARRVYAIEETSIIGVAREIARANHMDDRIVFIEGSSLDVELDERADVVFGDLMGPDPLGAGMLVCAHDAASRFLRPDGVLIPAWLALCAVGVDSRRIAREAETAQEWLREADSLNSAFGLELSPLVDATRESFEHAYESFAYKEFLEAATKRPRDRDCIVTAEVQICDVDLRVTDPRRTIHQTISLDVVRSGTLNAIATYATVHLDRHHVLSTSPFAENRPRSWGGQFVSTLDPVAVEAGTTVELQAEVTPWTSPAVQYRIVRRAGSDRRQALFGR